MSGEKTRDYRDVDYTAKVAIMVGAELVGLSDAAVAAADEHIAIPMHGLGTSLNVSVAVGVILLEAERQRLAAGLYERSRLTPEERERTLFEWSYPDIAERCRQHGRPYPPLKADGTLASNPLIDVVDGQPAGVTDGYLPPFDARRGAVRDARQRLERRLAVVHAQRLDLADHGIVTM